MTRRYSVAEIGDVQMIRNRLAQHSRGVDRTDEGLLTDCYHAEGTVDYRFYEGAAATFAGILTGAQRGQPVTLHRTAQMDVRLDGDAATSESYVMAMARSPDPDGGMMQRLICGRYLDRHARRDGEWRLTHRTYVLDANLNWPADAAPAALGSIGNHVPAGGQGTADAGIALMATAVAKNKAYDSERQTMTQTAPTHDAEVIDAIVSRQQIIDLTMAYCRGVDRADQALLAEIFHEDSVVVSGVFNGSGPDFAREICQIVTVIFDKTFHSIANQWIEVDGDRAVGESYVIAVASGSDGEGGQREYLSGGRYIDRFERRDGVWKIAERTFVSDWSRADVSSEQRSGMYGALDLHGARGSDDPVYSFWNAGKPH